MRIFIASTENERAKMNRKQIIKDMENMEEVLGRTADRCDIWQDRVIYTMAMAIWHILQWMEKQSKQ